MWAARLSNPDRSGSLHWLSKYLSIFLTLGMKVAWSSLAAHKVTCFDAAGCTLAPLSFVILATNSN